MQLSVLPAHEAHEVFAALGERVRLRLACCLLAAPAGLCVCELVDALGVSQPNVSRHLKLLKAAGLVAERREGRWMYYRLRNPEHPLVAGLRPCLETVCCCEDVQDDLRRLRARMRLRRGGKCVVGST
ncbi:MAG: ArsR/SmtB family transcription factor [Tepidiformaceae bacterium]